MSTYGNRAGRGRRTAAAACGMLLVVGAGLLGWSLLNQHPEPQQPPRAPGAETGSIPGWNSDGQRTPAPPAPVDDQPAETGSAGTEDTVTSGPDNSGHSAAGDPEPAATAPPLGASAPQSISIPVIDVASPVNPIGLNDDGSLAVPTGENYDEAAWFTGSPAPGEVGPAVIEGHVTRAGSTPSVFFDLGAVTDGDRVEVMRGDGAVVTFEVYQVARYPKAAFPTDAVYGNTEGPELRLITCGGEYDPEGRRHVDNIVVYARMVAS